MAVTALACAITLLVNGCVWGCEARGCLSGAFFSLPAIPLADGARLDGASIEICHNDVCGTATLAVSSTTHTGSSVAVADSLHSDVQVIVSRFETDVPSGYEVGYNFDVRIRARHDVLVDGDVYIATVTAVDGTQVTATSLRAPSHSEIYPNGEDCDDRPCRVAELTPL